MTDVADFLRGHELFAELGAADLEALAERVHVETFPAGAVIAPAGGVRLIRRGAVDLLDDERPLDRLGEGELIGHPSMLAGLPAGFQVRAVEDTVLLRLAAADAASVLALLARPGRAAPLAPPVDATRQRVAQLTREPAVLCEPDLPVREAARRMVEARASCVLVCPGSAAPTGIVTDADLRSRVLASGRSVDAPLAEVMTSPVVTVPAECRGADAILTMLDHGIRHVPVVTPRGETLGVLRDIDLLAIQARTPFVLRHAIALAGDVDDLRRAYERLTPTVLALHDAHMNAAQISGVLSVVTDALIRRLLELSGAPAGLSWIALGSYGRREPMPSSDLDSAVCWEEPAPAVVAEVLDGLEACGVHSDPHGATARNSLFARSTAEWERRIEELLRDPGREQELILLSLLCDARAVTGGARDAFEALRGAAGRPRLRRLLLRVGLAPRPPTGFFRDFVVEHTGEHRGRLDIKRGGLLPLVNLARYGGLAAGSRATGTVERLTVAEQAGTLPRLTADTLLEAFEMLTALRLEHQVEALRAGRAPDDHIDPRTLNPLARRYLRGAFRAIASIQRTLGNELELGDPGI
jgi:CBS domain-containing protein